MRRARNVWTEVAWKAEVERRSERAKRGAATRLSRQRARRDPAVLRRVVRLMDMLLKKETDVVWICRFQSVKKEARRLLRSVQAR